MPITSSAKKALRQNIKRRKTNAIKIAALKKVLKNYKKVLASKKMDDAKKFLPGVYQALDKAAKINLIKKGTASRIKSRLAKKIK
ncbi:MAG TPA: 30S ribosomal protein S20 [Candidatus Paceibacterota bacterium]